MHTGCTCRLDTPVAESPNALAVRVVRYVVWLKDVIVVADSVMTTGRELVTVATSPELDKNDVGVPGSSEVPGGGWVNVGVVV